MEKPDLSTGQRFRVHAGNLGIREGEIIYVGETFFTIKFKNYPESFQFFELRTGSVRLEAVK